MIVIAVTFFGLVIGSFLTALLHRLHTGASLVNDRSRCTDCGVVLSWYELIPLISFIVQKGRCRHCGEKISWQYPAIVGICGALFATIALQYKDCTDISCGGSLSLLLFWVSLAFAITVYDLRWMLIPDELLVAGGIVVLVSFPFWLAPDVWHVFSLESLLSRLIGLIIAGGFLFLLFLGSRGRAMGFGDVKLATLLGFLLGWQGSIALLVIAFVVGGIVGLVLLVTRKATRRSKIPFGPYLAGAGVLVLLWGVELIDWYLSFAAF